MNIRDNQKIKEISGTKHEEVTEDLIDQSYIHLKTFALTILFAWNVLLDSSRAHSFNSVSSLLNVTFSMSHFQATQHKISLPAPNNSCPLSYLFFNLIVFYYPKYDFLQCYKLQEGSCFFVLFCFVGCCIFRV